MIPARMRLAAFLLLAAPVSADTFYVNGQTGVDDPSHGTAASAPWKTIGYALAQIPRPTQVLMTHTLVVAGGQVYGPATNGESFPIRPAYNVAIEGRATPTPPVLAANGGTLLLFDPLEIYNRNQVTIRTLVFRGGEFGADMGGLNSNRHRPRLIDCTFEMQSVAGIRMRERGLGIADPRFFKCRFRDEPTGILAIATGNAAVLRPDIEECTFERITHHGLHVEDQSGVGSDVGGLLHNSWFDACWRGVYLRSGTNAYLTRMEVRNTHFRGCTKDGIFVEVGRPFDPDVLVEQCTFVGGEYGFRLQGNFTPGSYRFQVLSCIARDAQYAGFGYEIRGDADVRVISEDNWASTNRGAGFSLRQFDPTLRLNFTSLGDRALDNGGHGFVVWARDTTAGLGTARIESGILCGNVGDGLEVTQGGNVVARFLTLSSNGGHGLNVVQSPFAHQFDHLVLSDNAVAEIAAPPATVITHTCTRTQSYPGTGNLQANPSLLPVTYKLAANSPCIDAGDLAALTPATDFEGDPRVLLGRLGNRTAPDMGGDEYQPNGNAVRIGVAGNGADGFQPHIAASTQQVVLGGSIDVELREAADFWGNLAPLAVFLLGTSEDCGGLAPSCELTSWGAPGSFLYQNGTLAFGPMVIPSPNGLAVTLPVPANPAYVGLDLVAQWFVIQPGTNAGGFVTTDALRMTIH